MLLYRFRRSALSRAACTKANGKTVSLKFNPINVTVPVAVLRCWHSSPLSKGLLGAFVPPSV